MWCCRVKVLTVHWLLDSCTRGEKMAEENYFLLQRDDEKPKDTTENPKKRQVPKVPFRFGNFQP